ncbi:MAG: ribonuclease domain-containing protein [Micromonosporaceae bacterium]
MEASPRRRGSRGLATVLALVLALSGAVWLAGCEVGAPAGTSRTPSTSDTPRSGLPQVAVAELPAEARDVLETIERGGPYDYPQDDQEFRNRERRLPERERGYYREYTVPTPGEADRGARRLVVGEDGDVYYTADHYESFRQVRL